MARVEDTGNEALCGPAWRGDEAAIEELDRRGNTAISPTELQKTIKGSQLIGYGLIKPDDVVTVVNGRVKTVNGNPYP